MKMDDERLEQSILDLPLEEPPAVVNQTPLEPSVTQVSDGAQHGLNACGRRGRGRHRHGECVKLRRLSWELAQQLDDPL